MRTLRVATYLSPNIRPVYELVSRRLGEALDRPVELVDGGDFDELARVNYDVGFICGLPYVLLTETDDPLVVPLAAPVLEGDRYGDRPIYFSDVIVHRDSTARGFADLRDCAWAYNEPHSHSGYNVTRHRLVEMGATDGFFSSVVQASFHVRAIRMVAAGEVDASAIDSQVLAVELRDHPELGELVKVVDELGPATIQPVVASSALEPGVREQVRDLLVTLHRDPANGAALSAGLVRRFDPVTDADYDDIRAMLAAARRAGFEVLR